MEYDSASSCEGCLRDYESEDLPRLKDSQNLERPICNTAPCHSLQIVSSQPKFKLGKTNKSLSSQVMEYYHKYSQNANLDQYFSLPTTSTSPEAIKYYYSIYELNPKLGINRQDCIGEEYNLRSYVPRERRRWVRPPLIGQSSNTDSSPRYIQPLSNPGSPSPDLKHATTETIQEEKETQDILTEITERKVSSPTSSVASHKPLEWDSGADVGYCNILPHNKQSDKRLSTIERMALARGCSAALRLDPEGTTESGISGKLGAQKSSKSSATPDANSTLLLGNASGSESEIEITPIVKNHLPGIIAGGNIKSEISLPKDFKLQDVLTNSKKESCNDTPKSTFMFKVPFVKCPTEVRKVKQTTNKENICQPISPLKKSTSMNTLVIPPSKLMLKRSQSELNLHGRDKNRAPLPLIFNSSSSIATIVNKPLTCDKVIQTSLNTYTQESVGVQVSVLEEEKPPLPKRATSLHKNFTLTQNPKGTYKVSQSGKQTNDAHSVTSRETKSRRSCSEGSQGSGSRTQLDEAENITGRANSFEYFPGHIYENVPNGSGSRVSSSDSRSHSTVPNTSSSINEKLWGDSDSLVRDLERSVNILKSLVDANKCDKEVKKRLIHHVVKRLMTAKYTDDKIEHNLEDNVPWNPDDARNKVYRTEILQALAKKHITSDSSGDWNTRALRARKAGERVAKNVALGSSSDKVDKMCVLTDRTETDGRKARLGLRSDDCRRSSNTLTDKSESSECFFPQRGRKVNKVQGHVQDIFCADRCKSRGNSTMASTPPDHNRMLLDAVVNNRRAGIRSSNNTEEQADWRLLTTLSERQFELRKCSNSDSGDSKLVSYAEMEKRNQLIWITNEISHLCNLKKLLEEPRRLERSRSSPRKSRSANLKPKPVMSLAQRLAKDDYLRTNESDGPNSVNDPWSSHCNLATCQPASRVSSVVQRVKKRNSSAQTATNIVSAHSKTGGEIISASSMRNSMKVANASVQTVPQETAPTLIQSEIVHYIKCPAHDAMHYQNSCKCNEQVTQCTKHRVIQNVVSACVHCLQEQKDQVNKVQVQTVHANADHFREDSPMSSQAPLVNGDSSSSEMFRPCASKDVNHVKQKEAKNQINASKSRHSCECRREDQKSKGCQISAIAETPSETNSGSRCEECQKKVLVTALRERNDASLKGCNCTSACDCENGQGSMRSQKYRQENNGWVPTSNQNGHAKLCGCQSDCSCENNRVQEIYAKTFCNCHPNGIRTVHNGTPRAYQSSVILLPETEDSSHVWSHCVSNGHPGEASQYKVQSGSKCNCEEDCSCVNKRETAKNGEVKSRRGYNGNLVKVNYVDEATQANDSDRSQKCCRQCDAASQNAKKCSCNQTYPKAIAYELSFTENERKDGSGASQKVPLSNRNGGRNEGCVCNMVKKISLNKNSPQKNTLQDYLTKNKADFVNNAETRRQYMSEISHLRQLRKEKRIQLLAMASTSKVVKSPKASAKPAVYTQKKMSDEEMRERLRKRYFRLNEVRFKKRLQEKQEEARRNKLMAKIFCKKLQQKVLRGQVDLSQSVSVISNM